MRHAFRITAGACAAVLVAFLAVPVAAVLLRVPPGAAYVGDVALDALAVTARTSLVANAVFLALGTPAAYVLATHRFPGRSAVLTLTELPLVLPPAVAGVGLLVAFGRMGLLGGALDAVGVRIPFTQAAVCMAVVFVAGPVYLRGAVAAFQAVDGGVLDAARTLGAAPGRVFARVAVPMATGGLGSAWALAFARGLGEFGATIIVAGSIQGRTQTLPLAVYAELDDLDAALAVGGLLVLVACALLLLTKLVAAWRTA